MEPKKFGFVHNIMQLIQDIVLIKIKFLEVLKLLVYSVLFSIRNTAILFFKKHFNRIYLNKQLVEC